MYREKLQFNFITNTQSTIESIFNIKIKTFSTRNTTQNYTTICTCSISTYLSFQEYFISPKYTINKTTN